MHQSFVAVLLVVVMLTNIFMTWKIFERNGHSPFQELTVTTLAQNRIAEDRALAHIF